MSWSPWKPILPALVLTPDTLAETLDGGQAFRWARVPQPEEAPSHHVWRGQWADNVAEIRRLPAGIEWRAPSAIATRVEPALADYLALDTDWAMLGDTLPCRTDAHLAVCLRHFPALRLLRQPLGETLLGFLCSATKQIVQIKQMMAALAQRHGTEICAVPGEQPARRLPTWAELAHVPEKELRRCQLGFRAGYVAGTARFLAARPGWLEETGLLPYAEAKERLRLLPGVGDKIADCVLLFGAAKLEAFPVDTWIIRALAERYQLEGWKPAQLAQFGRAHFGPLAGLAQQYLFAYERQSARAAGK